MNRKQLQRLADEREKEARALLRAKRWSGAYYLAGYAVECGLKACVAKMTKRFDFPDRERAVKCYTHKVEVLADLARLRTDLDARMAASTIFRDHWKAVKDWDESARYQLWKRDKAEQLVAAVTDSENGVLPWIRLRW